MWFQTWRYLEWNHNIINSPITCSFDVQILPHPSIWFTISCTFLFVCGVALCLLNLTKISQNICSTSTRIQNFRDMKWLFQNQIIKWFSGTRTQARCGQSEWDIPRDLIGILRPNGPLQTCMVPKHTTINFLKTFLWMQENMFLIGLQYTCVCFAEYQI